MSNWLVDLILCFALFLLVFIAPWVVQEAWKRVCKPAIQKVWPAIRNVCCCGAPQTTELPDAQEDLNGDTQITWHSDDGVLRWYQYFNNNSESGFADTGMVVETQSLPLQFSQEQLDYILHTRINQPVDVRSPIDDVRVHSEPPPPSYSEIFLVPSTNDAQGLSSITKSDSKHDVLNQTPEQRQHSQGQQYTNQSGMQLILKQEPQPLACLQPNPVQERINHVNQMEQFTMEHQSQKDVDRPQNSDQTTPGIYIPIEMKPQTFEDQPVSFPNTSTSEAGICSQTEAQKLDNFNRMHYFGPYTTEGQKLELHASNYIPNPTSNPEVRLQESFTHGVDQSQSGNQQLNLQTGVTRVNGNETLWNDQGKVSIAKKEVFRRPQQSDSTHHTGWSDQFCSTIDMGQPEQVIFQKSTQDNTQLVRDISIVKENSNISNGELVRNKMVEARNGKNIEHDRKEECWEALDDGSESSE